MRFSDLTPGYTFPSTVLALDAQTVERYLRATQDDHVVYWRDGAVHLVPPLAVAALALRGIAQEVALAPGSLHTGQELLFRRLVRVGERLTAQLLVLEPDDESETGPGVRHTGVGKRNEAQRHDVPQEA